MRQRTTTYIPHQRHSDKAENGPEGKGKPINKDAKITKDKHAHVHMILCRSRQPEVRDTREGQDGRKPPNTEWDSQLKAGADTDDEADGGPKNAALVRALAVAGAESKMRVVYCPGVPPPVPRLIVEMPLSCSVIPKS